MTDINDTTAVDEKLQDTTQPLRHGYDGLAVIRAIEAGETTGKTSVPAHMQVTNGHIFSLCENGDLWIVPDGGIKESMKKSEVIPASKVAMLYRVFWPIAVAQLMELADEVKEQRKAEIADLDAALRTDRRRRYPKIKEPEIFTAPNCDASILTHPPRIVRDCEGFQRLQLKGYDGWEDQGVVEEVTRMERHGLVLVATDIQAFLMTAADFDNPIE